MVNQQSVVLHVIERLSVGGAARSLLALTLALKKRNLSSPRILSLLPPDPGMQQRAEKEGISIVSGNTQEIWLKECQKADIVQVYFWNSPLLYEFLQSQLPPIRLIVWAQVNCVSAPHALTQIVRDKANLIIASGRFCPPGVSRSIGTASDFERLSKFAPAVHSGFNVGYIGTVDTIKMHPHFIAMSAAVIAPDVKFLVYGSGDGFKRLKQQADALNARERFLFKGFVEDISSAFAELDVFGYPLCEDNYSTFDLVLQEALYCGVTPVVFQHGGAAELVVNNETGLVVHSEREYSEALEFLYRNPEVLARMKHAAREYARAYLGAERSADEFAAVYRDLMKTPKRIPTPTVAPCPPRTGALGASRFVTSLGGLCDCFSTSLYSEDETAVRNAEMEISRCSPVVASPGGGGVFDYARYYRLDPYLRLWCGLILEHQGRTALALGEYHHARRLGLIEPRLEQYIRRVTMTSHTSKILPNDLLIERESSSPPTAMSNTK